MNRIACLAPVFLAATASANPKPELEVTGVVGTDMAMTHQALAVGGEIPFPWNPMWRAHGQVTYGTADNSAASMGPNGYMQTRLGIEARPCFSPKVCVIAGVDAALMTESYVIGRQDTGNDAFGTLAQVEERGGFALVPRVLLDVGEGNLRFRPGVEATLSATMRDGNWGNRDLNGVAATAAVAYRF
jgi:hypothetical protein